MKRRCGHSGRQEIKSLMGSKALLLAWSCGNRITPGRLIRRGIADSSSGKTAKTSAAALAVLGQLRLSIEQARQNHYVCCRHSWRLTMALRAVTLDDKQSLEKG